MSLKKNKIDKPIRIAQVIGPVISGGVETVVMNYYRNIDRSKVQFDFIIDGYKETYLDDEIRNLGGHVYKVEPYKKNIIRSMKQYYKIFKENHYTIVHCHMNTLSIFPLFSAWLAGIPIRISHNHSTVSKGEGKRAILKYLLRPLAKIFSNQYAACSEITGIWLFGRENYDLGKVKMIHNAINLEKFKFDLRVRVELRNELNLNDKFVIGHVGRFVYAKNHDFLIDIFEEVHKINHNAVLVLVGNGPLEQEIMQKIKKLKLESCIKYLGVRHDVNRVLQALDVFVFPSTFEGLGIAAIESQVAGLSTIVSENIPKESYINNIRCCNLSESPNKWAEVILLSDINNRIINMERFINSGYSIKEESENLITYYYELLIKHQYEIL